MYKDKILNLLRSSKTGFLSGEELARKCGISRTMVWKHIKSLEREGFGIEAVPSQGYRITSVPDMLRLDDIRHGLKTTVIGKEIHLFPETASTNSLAMEMAAKGAPEAGSGSRPKAISISALSCGRPCRCTRRRLLR
jgi:BirA family biotin operon repressor/biotin-[acetyl-CoA-carboxylase] ligase